MKHNSNSLSIFSVIFAKNIKYLQDLQEPENLEHVADGTNRQGWQRPYMRWLQLQFDFDSTGVRLLIKGH